MLRHEAISPHRSLPLKHLAESHRCSRGFRGLEVRRGQGSGATWGADGDEGGWDHILQLLRACLSHQCILHVWASRENRCPARTRLQPPPTPCHPLSASGATLCPSKCSAIGLMHGYFSFKSTVTANIHLISLLLTSWSQPSKPGWGEHTSSNNGWCCRQDSWAPFWERGSNTTRAPLQARSFWVWLSCWNFGSRQLPRDSRVYFLPAQADFLPPPTPFYSLKVLFLAQSLEMLWLCREPKCDSSQGEKESKVKAAASHKIGF